VGTLAWIFVPDDPHLPPLHDDAAVVPVTEPEASAPAPRDPIPQAPILTELQGAREAVPAPEPEPEVDPCAELQVAFDAESAARVAAEREVAELQAQVARLSKELDLIKYPEDSPYGAFLSSYEADEIDDPDILAQIEDWLRQFPVILRPGEATWIAERLRLRDWQEWGGRNFEVSLILFLGPDRLAAELPEARMAELRAHYADESLFD